MTRDLNKPLGLDDVLIVDCDVHANEPPEALAPYIDMPWRRSLELLGRGPQRYLDIPGYAPVLNIDPPFPDRGLGARTVTSARQMRDDLDEMSIDIGILFPDNLLKQSPCSRTWTTRRLWAGPITPGWPTPGSAAKQASTAPSLATCPRQDPRGSAEQIRAYGADDRFVAVYLPVAGLRPLWGDRVYDPIFEAAAEMGLPVMLHSVGIIHPNFPFNLDHVESRLVRHPINHEFALMANLFTMISTGVPVRYPDLEIVFTEGGVSWVPFVMWRMDKEYAELPTAAPFLERPPSDYIRKMYFCTQPVEEPDRPQDLRTMIDLFDGRDQVIFASDWPHHDFDHPRKVLNMPFDAELKRNIMGETARRLFKLPVPVPVA